MFVGDIFLAEIVLTTLPKYILLACLGLCFSKYNIELAHNKNK